MMNTAEDRARIQMKLLLKTNLS